MVIMDKILAILLLAICLTTVRAQDDRVLAAEDSDPEATRILEAMEAYIGKWEKIKVNFSVKMQMPGEDPFGYDGHLLQQGPRYFVEAGDIQIYCDGATRWIVTRSAEEVNIYDVIADGEPNTPLDYLHVYRSEEFVYRLADEYAGKDEHAIEFKPLEKYSDYSKIRLVVSDADNRPLAVELFEKGGSRTHLIIRDIQSIEQDDNLTFSLDKKDYPGYHFEDLRID